LAPLKKTTQNLHNQGARRRKCRVTGQYDEATAHPTVVLQHPAAPDAQDDSVTGGRTVCHVSVTGGRTVCHVYYDLTQCILLERFSHQTARKAVNTLLCASPHVPCWKDKHLPVVLRVRRSRMLQDLRSLQVKRVDPATIGLLRNPGKLGCSVRAYSAGRQRKRVFKKSAVPSDTSRLMCPKVSF